MISGGQQRDLGVHMHVSILPPTPLPSVQFCFIRTENMNYVRDSFLQGFKKTDRHVHRCPCGLRTWEASVTMEGVTSIRVPGREVFHLYFIFIFNMDFLYFWLMHPFL